MGLAPFFVWMIGVENISAGQKKKAGISRGERGG